MRYSLYIGNKNYSSWSMRPWVLMKQAGIDFLEIKLGFNDSFHFAQTLVKVTPVGKVPVLIDHHQSNLAVWDSLAIIEYLAEQHPDKQLWPVDPSARSRARCLCAEMHSGFMAIRQHFPMNIEASLPEVWSTIFHDYPAVVKDLSRIVAMWSEQLEQSGGPMLFGSFCAVDAFYAPICLRLKTYHIAVPTIIENYIENVLAAKAVASWIAGALEEKDFFVADEPYRMHRKDITI